MNPSLCPLSCAVAVLCIGSASLAASTIDFPSRAFAASAPSDLLPIDYDGDGDQDIVVITQTDTPELLCYSNHGFARFEYRNSLPVYTPMDATVADLNQDGRQDLVCLGRYNNQEVFLATGNNTIFSSQRFHATNGRDGSIVTGDFDEDGEVDAVTVTAYNDPPALPFIVFMRGDGNGGFLSPFASFPITNPSVAGRVAVVGDRNEDGFLDVVIGGDGPVYEMLGNGDGTFDQPTLIATGPAYTDIALADLNGDTHLDVAILSPNTLHSVTFGSGSSAPGGIVSAASSTGATAVSNVDNDGDLDLVVTTPVGARVFRNSGAGTFDAGTTYQPGGGPYSAVRLFDASGHGQNDIVLTELGRDRVVVMANRGGGNFAHSGVSYAMRSSASSFIAYVVPVDLNEDGHTDLLASNPNEAQVSIRLGSATGTLGARTTVTLGGDPRGLAFGDLNHDGHVDLVAASKGDSRILVALGDGTGALAFLGRQACGENPDDVILADLDADGKLDLVVSDPGWPGATEFFVPTLHGNGDGTFAPPTQTLVSARIARVRVGDLNEDGKPDIVALTASTGHVFVLPGNGDGTFLPVEESAGAPNATEMRLADFNGDGHLDVVTAHSTGTAVQLQAGIGSGALAPIVALTSQTDGSALDVADLDLDGDSDAVAGLPLLRALTIVDNTPQVNPPSVALHYPFFGTPQFVQLAPMDSDARPDAIITELATQLVWVFPNTWTPPPVDVASDEARGGAFLFVPVVQPGGTVRIRYSLAAARPSHLGVYDVRGRRLWQPVGIPSSSGEHVLTWNARDAAGSRTARGVYFVRLSTPETTVTRKFALVR